MSNGRTKNSILNVSTSLLEYLIKTVLVFVTRTVLINKLGAEFLGLDGLYTNILSLLSVTELGLGGAVIFSMYKPIIDGDTEKLNILVHIYKKCYFYIGLAIFVMGLVLMPFLPRIINSSYDFGNIYGLFAIYMLQTLATYWFFAYKEAIMIAHQRKYKLTFAINFTAVLKFVLQLTSLIAFQSFVMYIISGLITTLIKNILVARIADREHPYAKKYNGKKLERAEKKILVKNVFGMSLYRISSAVMNSTDNIIISAFINITIAGIYSNYLLIVMNIKNILNTIFTSMTSSVGNLFAEGDREKSEFIFRCLNFMNFWLYGFAGICLWELLNPFINVWIGKEYLFEYAVVLVIVLNFVTDGLQQAVILYKDACGLFWKGKLRPIFSAGLNIIISIILVRPLGILGVILGSIISRMVTTWWFDPILVYKNAFQRSAVGYFFRYARSMLLIVLAAVLIDGLAGFVDVDGFTNLLMRFALCLIIPNILFWAIFRKSEEFVYIRTIVMSKLRRKK